MATVKIQEGTKKETSLELEDGEGVIFVVPIENNVMRFIAGGCLFFLKPSKVWYVNLVITDKRLIAIPVPPNKKNYKVESYYFKDMDDIVEREQSNEEAMSQAKFGLKMKQGGNSTYENDGGFSGDFTIIGKRTIGKLVKGVGGGIVKGLSDQFEKSNAMIQAQAKTMESKAQAEATGAATYTEYSPNYAAMEKAAKARIDTIDTSNSDHFIMRDCVFHLVYAGMEVAKG
jgi:hypothetical protein